MLGCILAAFLGTGCVERILQVRSDPPGARVYVNGEDAGETPCDHPFTFYGTVDVVVRAPGTVSSRKLVSLSPPWYQIFPLDLVTDVIVPWTIRDVHEVRIELRSPAPEETGQESRRDLERKADAMRELLGPGRSGELREG